MIQSINVRVFVKVLMLALGLLSQRCLNAQHNHIWQRINPGGGGAFSTIEAGPSGIILAGSDLGGAYISYDRGASWSVIGSAKGLTDTHVSGLGFHPTDSDIFYIGTETGIYRSPDGGNSVAHLLFGGYITDIKPSPADPNIVYATYQSMYNSLDGEVFKSTNNGMSFSRVSSNLPNRLHLLKLVPDPTNADIIYLLAGNGRFACGPPVAFRSSDGGVTWSQMGTDLGDILDIAVKKSSPGTVYLTTMNTDCDAQYYWTDVVGSFYQSTDGGLNFTMQSARTGIIWPKSDGSIRLIDPREPFPWNPDSGSWKSVDSGVSWTKIGAVDNWDYGYQGVALWSYGTSYNGIVKTLGFDASNENRIYWVNTQWVFVTDNEGTSFKNLYTTEVTPNMWSSTGFDNVVMMDLVIAPSDRNVVYAGYWDIGFWRSTNHGDSWQASNQSAYTGGWEGNGGNACTIAVDPHDANKVWTTMQGETGSAATLIKSTSGGLLDSWVKSNAGLPSSNVILGLSVDARSPAHSRILFVTCNR